MTETNKKIILFIDDDEDDLMLLKDVFKAFRTDVELRWAKDGEEGLDYIWGRGKFEGTQAPLIILLDLNMPKLNGYEFLTQIRANEQHKHIPVVMFSNSMNKNDALHAYRSGINSFIRKPAGYTELRDFAQVFCKYWFDYSTLG